MYKDSVRKVFLKVGREKCKGVLHFLHKISKEARGTDGFASFLSIGTACANCFVSGDHGGCLQ